MDRHQVFRTTAVPAVLTGETPVVQKTFLHALIAREVQGAFEPAVDGFPAAVDGAGGFNELARGQAELDGAAVTERQPLLRDEADALSVEVACEDRGSGRQRRLRIQPQF